MRAGRQQTEQGVLPAGMPALSRGRHRGPEQGACLLEYTSLLAGESFSDKPNSVEPTLAALVRILNDALDPDARSELAHLAPALIGTAGGGASARHAVVELVTDLGLSVPVPLLVPAMRRGLRHTHRTGPGEPDRRRCVGICVRAVRAAGASVVLQAGGDRTALFVGLLRDAVRVHQLAASPPSPSPYRDRQNA